MKKIVYFLLFALCLPIGLMAQSADDDLYFVPSKDKQEKKTTPVRKEPKKQVTNIYTSPGTTVVVQDRKGRTRDVDEYNRRYDARDNDFVMDNDTLYIREKSQPDLDGEWVTGEFNGTQEDYEYAERIIRFRNPRFAISISSPLYWDVVYGPNSWDWNVYTDGLYAYAFPTFSNPLWWDWRYSSYSWGWNYGWGWNRPYYSWGYAPGYWGGWYGGYWGGWYGGGGYWGHHHHWHGGPDWGWGGGGRPYYAGNTYTNRRSYGYNNFSSSPSRRSGSYSDRRSAINTDRRTSSSSYTGRTVGTRREATRVSTGRTGVTTRSDASSVRRSSNYTRPSSTRSSSTYNSNREGSVRRSASTPVRSSSSSSYGTTRRSSSTYNRGTSTSSPSTRSSSPSTRSSSPSRSYDSSRSSSSSRSYSPSSSNSSRSSSSGYSGGSRSSGGGSSRGGRR